jgi:hypothetical protein
VNEPPARSRRGAWPAGLLGMVALLATAESFVARHDRDFTTIWASSWRHSDLAARGEARRCAVLGFGDSLVKHGLAPQVIEATLGRPAYNLAVFNGVAPSSFVLLRRALESGARPEAVLVDGELLEVDPRTHARLWAELATVREGLELALEAHDAGLFGALALARLLPTVKARYEIRDNLRTALRGETPPIRYDLLPHWRNWRLNRGAQFVPARPPAPDFTRAAIERAGYFPTSWRCDPVNAAYVRKFLRLAAAQRVPVYWLLPPVNPEIQRRRDRGGRDPQYEDFLRRLQSEYPNLVVLDGRHSGYDLSAMWDLTHLNRRGAAAFSADVALVLRDRLAGVPGPRWVALAAYRDPSGIAPLEDVDQSRLALRAKYTSRRR